MIVYNITSKVAGEIHAAWLQWLRSEAIPSMMATGLFTEYRLNHLLEQDETDGITYTLQFTADSMEQIEIFRAQYFQDFSLKERILWGDLYVSFQTLMEVIN
jgi:hypothetical protein